MGLGRPGVFYKQRDISQIVVGADSSVGGAAGTARWGEVDKLQPLNNFDQYIQIFGKPVSPSETPMHYQALGFFKQGGAMYVVRPQGNSKYGSAEALDDAEMQPGGSPLTNLPLAPSGSNVAGLYTRFPGVHDEGDIKINIFDSDDTTGFFSIQVGIATINNGVNLDTGDPFFEEHVVSVLSTAKDGFGRSAFIEDVLERDSQLLRGRAKENATVAEVPINSTSLVALSQATYVSATASEIQLAYEKFNSLSESTIDLLFPGEFSVATLNKVIETAQTRGDCFAIISPDISETYTVDGISGTTGWKSNITTLPEYAAAYANTYKVRDTFNDRDVIVPIGGFVAGAYAFNDFVAAPWYAPAGPRRGRQFADLNNVWSEGDQDTLYNRNLNFVTKTPANGVTLQGQKTLLSANSALSRINVERLILYIKRNVLAFLEDFIYEFNNEFNRSLIEAGVKAFLESVGVGLTDFRVICNSINNTAQVIDENKLVCDIYIKPVRVAEFLFLKSTITSSAVDLDELIAQAPPV